MLTRRSRWAQGAILAAVVFNAVLPLLAGPALGRGAIVAGLVFVVALLSLDPTAIHVGLLTFLISLWVGVWPPYWPFFLLGPLIGYAVVVASSPFLRQATGWLRAGTFDGPILALVGLTGCLAAVALWLWFALWQPDISRWTITIPRWGPGPLILGGMGFALVNAAVEESIYRGIVMQGLDAALGVGGLAIILQAVPFGLIHLHGIPGEWIGVGMAMMYGLMLGLIRRRAQGMLAPFVAHVLADGVIFAILALWMV